VSPRRRPAQATQPPAQIAAGGAAPEYLTLEEGAHLLRFDQTAPSNPTKCFLRWLRRNVVPVAKRGKTVLVERRVLEGYLRGDAWTARRRSA